MASNCIVPEYITLYFGDPQELLLMNVRPRRTVAPRVNYFGQANAVLRIIDLRRSPLVNAAPLCILMGCASARRPANPDATFAP